MNEDIHEMKLHERIKIDVAVYVTRVPGGWLYELGNDVLNNGTYYVGYTTTFVPFNNEFMQKGK